MPTFREDLHLGHKVPLIETDDMRDGLVTTDKLSDNAVTEGKLADGAVTNEKLGEGAVVAGNIAEGAVENKNLAEGAVIAGNIAENAVTEGKLADGAVTQGKIAEGAVIAGNIAEGAVENKNLAEGAVIAGNIAEGAVMEGNLAAGAVTSDKLAPEVITQLETITDAEPTPGSVKPVQSGGTYRQILEAVTYDGDDVSDLANSWRNYGRSDFATVELDESGHNGTWHLLKKSVAGAAIRMYCGKLIDGKTYKLSFDCVVRPNVFISNIQTCLTFSSNPLGALYDVYAGKPVGIETGHKELTFVKTEEWDYLYIGYSSTELTFPINVTISNFSLREVVNVKETALKSVLFESQSLTDAQKVQARRNLGFGDGNIDTALAIGSMNPITNDAIAQEIGGEFVRGSAVLSADSATDIIPMQSVPTIKAGTTIRFKTDGFPDKITGAYLYINGSPERIFHITESAIDYTCETDINRLRVAVLRTDVKTGAAGSEIYISVGVKGIVDDINDVHNDLIKSIIEYNATYQNGVSYTNRADARASVPEQYQKVGMKLTYIYNRAWITEQFIGTEWNTNDEYWQDDNAIDTVRSNNLFNYKTVYNGVALAVDGTTASNPSSWTSPFIPIDENEGHFLLCSSSIYRIGLYTTPTSEGFVRIVMGTDLRNMIDITGISYIRICVNSTRVTPSTICVSYSNESDVFNTYDAYDAGKLSIQDPQFVTIDNLKAFFTDKVNNSITDASFNFVIRKGNLGNKNMIISTNAMFENTQNDDVPTIQFTYEYRNVTGYVPVSSLVYTLGSKDYYERKQWRMPAYPKGCYLKISINVPANVTLYVKDFENFYSNEINRNVTAIKLDGHGSGNVLRGFIRVAELGYPTCITIPKRTSDGVWVCFHDETIGTQLKDVNGHTPAQNHPEIAGNVGIWDLTYSELKTYTYAAKYDGTKDMVPTLEEFFTICAKTGMNPMLSLHPSPTVSEYQEIRALALKCGVLKQLELKPLGTDWTSCVNAFSVMGNDIKSYIIQASSVAVETVISRLDALGVDKDKVRVGAELSGTALTEANVAAYINAGYIVSTFSPAFTAEQYMYWFKQGVTEFTDDYNYSNGLNW